MKSSSFHQFFADIPNLTVIPIDEPIPIDVLAGKQKTFSKKDLEKETLFFFIYLSYTSLGPPQDSEEIVIHGNTACGQAISTYPNLKGMRGKNAF